MPGVAERILLPKEHGTYGELLCPMLSALTLARPGRASWGLAVLALSGFLAHEGFAVLAGRRGARALRDGRWVAWRSLMTLGVLAAAGAAVAWPALAPEALVATGILATLSVAAVSLTWFGREHTLGSELVAALTLSGWCTPIGLAGGLSLPVAAALWVIWAGVFTVATCAVRAVVTRTARRPIAPVAALGLIFAAATATPVALMGDAGYIPGNAGVTLIPAVVMFLVLTIAPIHATRLRLIGWVMMGMCLLTLALVVAVLG